jgi:NAD(P)-dependent dehydrogenase (short-subunit alcohol dehydrogenase family)
VSAGATHHLYGRTVVVTGGNGGIGLALASGVGMAGADVAIWARNPEKNKHALDRLAVEGVRARAVVCDVSDAAQVDAAMTTTLDHFGRIDALFANAGIAGGNIPFLDMSLEDLRAVMRVDVDGAFLCLQAAARHMVSRGGGGSLVAVSSIIARFGGRGKAHYGAAKTSVEGLMRSIAVELGPTGIRCNCLAPGWTDTEMLAESGTFGVSDPGKLRRATLGRTPVGRWGLLEDFRDVAVFLADPELTFHTGQVMVVDGGYSVT